MDTMDTGFDEFFSAFNGEDGYQTDTAEEVTEKTEVRQGDRYAF